MQGVARPGTQQDPTPTAYCLRVLLLGAQAAGISTVAPLLQKNNESTLLVAQPTVTVDHIKNNMSVVYIKTYIFRLNYY